MKNKNNKKIDLKNLSTNYSTLTLGVSMAVAIALGVGLGCYLKKILKCEWIFWLGVIWGIMAAFLNAYRAIKVSAKDLDEYAKSRPQHPKIDQD